MKTILIIALLLLIQFPETRLEFWVTKSINNGKETVLDMPVKIVLDENALFIGEEEIVVADIRKNNMKYTITYVLTTISENGFQYYIIEGTDIYLTGNFRYDIKVPVTKDGETTYIIYE